MGGKGSGEVGGTKVKEESETIQVIEFSDLTYSYDNVGEVGT